VTRGREGEGRASSSLEREASSGEGQISSSSFSTEQERCSLLKKQKMLNEFIIFYQEISKKASKREKKKEKQSFLNKCKISISR
jgi:hypothetical protein